MTFLGALMGFLAFSGAITGMPAQADARVAQEQPTYSVAMTGYNAVPGQTDEDPFTTASGAFSNPEVVAARSRDLADKLPFGTIIEIDGPASAQKNCGFDVVSGVIGYRVIADSMNKRFTDRVDVLFPNGSSKHNPAVVFGVCKDVTIRVVGHVDLKNPANLPKSQSALAALVYSSGGLALK